MEDKFIHDEFEEFLQDQVKNHRMYPSDAVWREIDRKLHGEKRWPALTIAAAMLVGATVLICVYFTPKTNIFTLPVADANATTQVRSDKSGILNNLTASIPFDEVKKSSSGISQKDIVGSVSKSQAEVTSTRVLDISASNEKAALGNANSSAIKNLIHPITSVVEAKNSNISALRRSEKVAAREDTEGISDERNVISTQEGEKNISNLPVTIGEIKNNRNLSSSANTNNYYSSFPTRSHNRRSGSRSKFSYQVYLAPSISYRKLLEDNSMIKENSGGPVGISYVTDVNKVVRHKPGTGMEVGLSFMYSLSKKVRVKSGFQFNMRQYSIEAYRSNTELASIALVGNNRLDTINTVAIYRTNNGYYSTKLVNRYYQLSAPIGIEWEVLGNKAIQLNVAGTIQPTYLLNRNAYLLSTNFKNYTESPGMVRQWNINSNVEAFISIRAGDYKWQLGPQLRYQPYSTFIPEYSIKEHLMDYGFKLGLSKTIR